MASNAAIRSSVCFLSVNFPELFSSSCFSHVATKIINAFIFFLMKLEMAVLLLVRLQFVNSSKEIIIIRGHGI
jgi:hypothetical protein